jgi:ribosomal protein S18 acetylase RimI-like enzyme
VKSGKGVSLIDEPSHHQIEIAAELWFQAESLRIPSPPYESYLEDQRRGFIDTVTRQDAWLTIALDGQSVIGLVGGLCPTESQPASYLGYVAVDLSHRRKAVGSFLMRHALARAAQMDASAVLLTVHETNIAARRLYERCGWLPTGRSESTPFDDEPLIEYSVEVPTEVQPD